MCILAIFYFFLLDIHLSIALRCSEVLVDLMESCYRMELVCLRNVEDRKMLCLNISMGVLCGKMHAFCTQPALVSFLLLCGWGCKAVNKDI